MKLLGKLKMTIPISNPNKILYPNVNINKLDVANYYKKIAAWILPYISKRPLTIVRCPEGQQGECFYQRHLNEIAVNGIYPINLKNGKPSEKPYFYIKESVGLMTLSQLDVLEIHPWGSRIDKLEKPDLITFDLDPGLDVEWQEVIETAFFIKESLQQINLTCFIKTTGSKGLHIVIPIRRQYSWEKVKLFAHTFVDYLAMRNPDLIVTNMNKTKRKGKVFVDYLRNQRGATSIAPYSTRIRENAAVATPLAWDEVSVRIKSDHFTIKTLPQRLQRLKCDPWRDFLSLKQQLVLPRV